MVKVTLHTVNAAQKWERQQRMFSDLGVSDKKQFYQLESLSSPETCNLPEWDDDMISAMHGACNTCDSRKHSTEQCTADMSKIKCFRCHKHGHQRKSRGSDGKGAGKRSKGVNKGDNWSKAKERRVEVKVSPKASQSAKKTMVRRVSSTRWMVMKERNGGMKMIGGMMSQEKCLRFGSLVKRLSGGLRIGQENGVMKEDQENRKEHNSSSKVFSRWS